MQLFQNLFELPDVDAYFFDMFGVLWNGHNFYPNALSVLKELRAEGKKVYIISNQTVTADSFISSREKQGFLLGTHYDDVITSGRVCETAVQNGLFEQITGKKNYRFYVLGLPNAALFESVAEHQTDMIEEADVFYIGSIQDNSVDIYQNEFIPQMERALKKRIPAVCANPDRFVIMGTDKKMVQGEAGRWYQRQGGHIAFLGKPFANIFEYALQLTGADKEKSVMVGDMLQTDIWGASNVNMRSVLMMETGVSAYEMEKQKITLNQLIHQVAQEEQVDEKFFTPTFCIPYAGILLNK